MVLEQRGPLLVVSHAQQRVQRGAGPPGARLVPLRQVLRAGASHQLHVGRPEHLAVPAAHLLRLVGAPAPESALISGT